MPTILGLDIATSCGVCWMDRRKPPSQWRCLAIQSEGDEMEEAATDLAMTLRRLLLADPADFAAIEMPQRSISRYDQKGDDLGGKKGGFTINPTTALKINQMTGAVVTILDVLGVPWGTVPVPTWRSAYHGKGVKPQDDDDWKDLAICAAKVMGVVLPDTKKAARDAAEALGVACAWTACTRIPARHQAAFMNLRTGKAA